MNVHSLSNASWLDPLPARWPAAAVPAAAKIGEQWRADALSLCPASKRYLVGVSGGRDSAVLLHWLLARGYRKLIVCHLDHRLRGRSSTADARFVARLAEANRLGFETDTVDVRQLAAATRQSIEAAGRAARFEFFSKVARRRRCNTIFLGHHADDLVETFLINLFRGSGLRGQRAILPIATRRVSDRELTIVRPLLSIWRTQIDEYVTANRLRFREDASNQQFDALRNRMRHRIIPMLEKEFGRDIRGAVRRASVIAAEEDAVLNDLLPPIAATLSVKQLRALPLALQRRIITRWLRMHAVADASFEMVERVRSLLDPAEGPAKVNLTGGRHARRRAGELFIE